MGRVSPRDTAKIIKKAIAQSQSNGFRVYFGEVIKMEARLKKRVFQDGMAADGSKIGTYSTKPMLAGNKTFTKHGSQISSSKAVNEVFGSKKKRKSRNWKTVKGKKLIEIKGGYKEFRELVGRQGNYVDLNLTGALQFSIKTIAIGRRIVIGIEDEENSLKARRLEAKYGKKIFKPTKQEIEDLTDKISESLIDSVLDNLKNG